MNLKLLFSRQINNNISRLHGRVSSPHPCIYRNLSIFIPPFSIYSPLNRNPTPFQNPKFEKPNSPFSRYIHSSQETIMSDLGGYPKVDREESEDDGNMTEVVSEEAVGKDFVMDEKKSLVISIPKRHVRIKSKIYGRDLSVPKWAEVADKIHETGEILWPQEPKPISGKLKLVTERILSLKEEDNPSPVLAEWVDLLQPNRIDWITLLDRLKGENSWIYFMVSELVLGEESFGTNIRDYSKLIEAHAQENRLDDTERILKKVNENGILPGILTFTVLVHMYSKAGNVEKAKEAFENLRSVGFQPCMTEMEARDIKLTKEIYMALLRSFAQRGDDHGAQRIATTMQFSGFQPTLESCTFLVEAFGKAKDLDQARSNFDYMIIVGHRPDDRCVACMIAAYEENNLLDKALDLLLEMEKDGFKPGVSMYSVLVDWLGRLQLIDEAECLLGKISEIGESPPLKVHVSLCQMYLKAAAEKKALQSLGVVEANKQQLGAVDFERIIIALSAAGFAQDATRIRGLTEALGFVPSEPLRMGLMASLPFVRMRPTMRYSMAVLEKNASRGFSTLSPGLMSTALKSSQALISQVTLVDELLETMGKDPGGANIDVHRVFSRIKRGGMTCLRSGIHILQKKTESPTFLGFGDFVFWYRKAPGKVKKDIMSFLLDRSNSVYVVEDFSDTLLQGPVINSTWQKPVEGFVKLNSDGSFKKEADGSINGGCGFVVRDHLGNVVDLDSRPLPFAKSHLDAEFVGIYLGVLLCKTIGVKKIVVESDSKEIIQVLSSARAPVEVESDLYLHLFRVLASFDDYKVIHQY